ncbi:hypothetical protein M758_N010400 [Ceratodon purpureus]|nr:hypothetical protein M758_N010400 [Ceratodon purpureus]
MVLNMHSYRKYSKYSCSRLITFVSNEYSESVSSQRHTRYCHTTYANNLIPSINDTSDL